MWLSLMAVWLSVCQHPGAPSLLGAVPVQDSPTAHSAWAKQLSGVPILSQELGIKSTDGNVEFCNSMLFTQLLDHTRACRPAGQSRNHFVRLCAESPGAPGFSSMQVPAVICKELHLRRHRVDLLEAEIMPAAVSAGWASP